MIYPIVKYGDPVLETPAKPVTAFDDKLKKLVEDMFESLGLVSFSSGAGEIWRRFAA